MSTVRSLSRSIEWWSTRYITHADKDTVNDSDLTATPSSFEWIILGSTTTLVNDQGHCGSCWAYSTTEGNVTQTRDRGYTVGGLATLTTEFTPTCLFDGSFSQSVSPRCITMKFVSLLVGLPCVFHPCLLRGSSHSHPD